MISAWVLCFVTVVTGASVPDTDRAAYETARDRAGRDASAHVDLALWCESRGMTADKTTHLTRAILIDPDDARARGLLGYVKHEGRWMRPDDVARAVEESPERQALLREYLDRRSRARDDADGQYKLALWCEEKGLPQPMVAHLHRVVQLDPGREGAWRRLGFKKVGSRWVNPEAEAAFKAAREAQDQADKAWKPRLEKLRGALAGKDKAKRAEAQADLAAIDDPRAVPMIWHVFARGGDERRQRVAIDVLSRIEAPSASAALALLAVYSPHVDLRTDAGRLLLRRDPRDYAGLLAGLIRDEVKYKVKPIDGPGSQGELFLEGGNRNVRRRYTPLEAPALATTDNLVQDDSGRWIAVRQTGRTFFGSTVGWATQSANGFTGRMATNPGSFNGPTLAGGMVHVPTGIAQNANLNTVLQAGGLSAVQSRELIGRLPQESTYPVFATGGTTSGRVLPLYAEVLQIPIQQMMAEAKASALIARQQLANDVQQIEAQNAPVRETNERAIAVLKNISGKDLGDDREKWMGWAVDLEGYAMAPKSPSETPTTIVEEVPLAFQPQAAPIATGTLAGFQVVHSCFAGETKVRTLEGMRAIETIRPGDLVLSQDETTGRLDYKAVVTAFHNPPNETYRIDLGGEAIHPTGIHRLWKAGHGWVMAREVQAGDRLRTIGGVAEVRSVEKEPAQPVFNLMLAGGDNFCVGGLGVIAHDNSHVEPVEKPFDGVPTLAVAGNR